MKNIISNFQELHEGESEVMENKRDLQTRDYVMVMLSWTNALRASNLSNMSIQHFDEVLESNVYVGAYLLKSPKYKTSLLYGSKTIVVSKELFQWLKIHISKLRPLITEDNDLPSQDMYVFTSSSQKSASNTMTQLTISNCLTNCFEQSGVCLFEDVF